MLILHHEQHRDSLKQILIFLNFEAIAIFPLMIVHYLIEKHLISPMWLLDQLIVRNHYFIQSIIQSPILSLLLSA